MTNKEAMQMALDALEEFCEYGAILRPIERRDALRTALAQPEKEWVGLTIIETSELWEQSRCALPRYNTFKSLIEAKLKEKNSWLLTQLK